MWDGYFIALTGGLVGNFEFHWRYDIKKVKSDLDPMTVPFTLLTSAVNLFKMSEWDFIKGIGPEIQEEDSPLLS